MYIGLLLREKGCPMQDMIDYLSEVTDKLVTRFIQEGFNEKLRAGARLGDKGNDYVLAIHMALAALTHMLVDPRVTRPPDGPCDKSWDGSMYPDPALLAESKC